MSGLRKISLDSISEVRESKAFPETWHLRPETCFSAILTRFPLWNVVAKNITGIA
jgi:hypothetical protein